MTQISDNALIDALQELANELEHRPGTQELLAALIVMVTAATITTALSWIGILISPMMASVMTIVGLGWDRAFGPTDATDCYLVVVWDYGLRGASLAGRSWQTNSGTFPGFA